MGEGALELLAPRARASAASGYSEESIGPCERGGSGWWRAAPSVQQADRSLHAHGGTSSTIGIVARPASAAAASRTKQRQARPPVQGLAPRVAPPAARHNLAPSTRHSGHGGSLSNVTPWKHWWKNLRISGPPKSPPPGSQRTHLRQLRSKTPALLGTAQPFGEASTWSVRISPLHERLVREAAEIAPGRAHGPEHLPEFTSHAK
jgi:hypothetical protein